MRGGRPGRGGRRRKSSGPNGDRSIAAGGGRLSCRLGGRTSSLRSADEASERGGVSGRSGPNRWDQADCASRANARRDKIRERFDNRHTMEHLFQQAAGGDESIPRGYQVIRLTVRGWRQPKEYNRICVRLG